MREFTIGKNDAGQRLDRFVAKNLPLLPPALLQKYIRLKRIKVNGKGSKRDVRLNAGDVLQLYISDEFFSTPDPEEAWRLRRRIAELTPILTQMNELAELTAHYYDRSYHKHEKYTL